jgi:RNA polymerase sigma-70 factor (ECF subfamily)
MRGLSDPHREILTLRHIEELSYTEIAEVLDVPKGTVMSRLHAARQSLREALERAG